MTRWTVAVALLVICVSAHAKPLAVPDDNAAALWASKLVTKYRLSTDKTECLFFDTFDKGASYEVRVRENHSPECGGAANTSPTLFFMRIRKSDGHAVTNAYDSEHFVPLRRVTKTD
ncbi:hypothetical protein [Paraburkholderia bryophila]|uniref:Protease inhibitor Inh n=1 Tax=Paraburkholderia bryophila TaxID=420952 RepID=A0A7Y9W3M9_9BURK|nr:hypothetical protein [Paraburkholderia bryophila]NYH13569.1 hypothetical protein [Paraburkholderia bryophila]